MKKNILIINLFLISTFFAQPILNETNLNFNNTSITYSASNIGFSIGSTGANQTWNYSNLILTQTGTTIQSEVLTAPFMSSFPNANLIVKNSSNGTDFFAMLKKTSTKLETLGISSNAGVLVNFTPNPQTQFDFPFSYNSIINDTYATTNDPATNNPFSINYDAYGTLITPFDTYNNVIRTKKLDGINPIYEWRTTNPIQLVLSVVYGSSGITSITFYKNSSLSTTENNLNEIKISSNPISENFQVINNQNNQSSFDYKIYDLSGRQISQNRTQFNSDINISSLSNGTYILEMKDDFGKTTKHKIIKK